MWVEDMITGHSYGTSPSIFSSCRSVFILKQSGVSACTCRMAPVITGAALKHQCGAGSKNPSPSMRWDDGDALLRPCGEQHWAFCAATQERAIVPAFRQMERFVPGNSLTWSVFRLKYLLLKEEKKAPEIIFPFFFLSKLVGCCWADSCLF